MWQLASLVIGANVTSVASAAIVVNVALNSNLTVLAIIEQSLLRKGWSKKSKVGL